MTSANPPRGQAGDSDDMALRSVMMVLPFSTSESIGDHPKSSLLTVRTACTRCPAPLQVATVRALRTNAALSSPQEPDDPTFSAFGIFGLKLLATAMTGSTFGMSNFNDRLDCGDT